jgi:hypothetical protein
MNDDTDITGFEVIFGQIGCEHNLCMFFHHKFSPSSG